MVVALFAGELKWPSGPLPHDAVAAARTLQRLAAEGVGPIVPPDMQVQGDTNMKCACGADVWGRRGWGRGGRAGGVGAFVLARESESVRVAWRGVCARA